MKKINVLAATAIVALGIAATSCDSKPSANLKSAVDSASYAIGVSTGAGYKENLKTLPGGEANIDALIAGFVQAIKGDSTKMTPEQAQNKTKDGVITTESGLQYKVEKEGTGAKPAKEDNVKVHYTGTLLDGSEFDSSVSRGEPAEFRVDRVIPGWTEILQIMPVGSKYIVWVPSELGYGPQPPRGSSIKPNSLLKFEIELLDIVKDDQKK